MQFHKSLRPLVDSISKLQFSVKHKTTRSKKFEEDNTVDVLSRTSCNGMVTEEFNDALNNAVKSIITESKELLEKLGTHYQKELLPIIIHTDRVMIHFFDGSTYRGIQESISGVDITDNEAYQLGAYEYGVVEKRNESKEEFYSIILKQLELLKSELAQLIFDEKQEVKPITKLEWNVKPAVLGSLLCELEKKRWINLPTTKGNVSYSKFAKQCAELFEFQGETSSLEKVLNRSTKPWSGANMFNFDYLENTK